MGNPLRHCLALLLFKSVILNLMVWGLLQKKFQMFAQLAGCVICVFRFFWAEFSCPVLLLAKLVVIKAALQDRHGIPTKSSRSVIMRKLQVSGAVLSPNCSAKLTVAGRHSHFNGLQAKGTLDLLICLDSLRTLDDQLHLQTRA